MTRYVVFREGTEPLPNVYVEIGALRTKDDGFIPVSWMNTPEELPIGRAKDFERDETGAISFDIEFREELDAREECFNVWANELVQRREGDREIILEGTIREIMFTLLPGYPPAQDSRKLQAS